TILFVSHSMGDVKVLGDRTLWLDGGSIRDIGATESVVAKYLAAMADKDSAYLRLKQDSPAPAVEHHRPPPEVVTRIPNIDYRHGDGRAEILGIAVLDTSGRPLQLLEPESRIVVRISVRAKEPLARPNVGFMLRNHLGVDVAGTNSTRDGLDLPPMDAGDMYTVDFHVDLPMLYPSHFSFSPAVADGTLVAYSTCDWIDNAITLQMGHGSGPVYGYIHLPCRVKLNSKIGEPRAAQEAERV
ncbi:MAG: Wzt carbohydrate-binding domain-containing protein, partial [Thermoleophilia bacterium]|nr:Wzt carbohydrate-binding domain-containing protein [Thermoleophilia bacterium]